MGKENRLLAQHGERIRESLGSRQGDPLELVGEKRSGAQFTGRKRAKGASEIDIGMIVAEEQYRKTFDHEKLERLAQSLKSAGQIQPIVVRWDAAKEKYVVVAGERRFRAAKLAGFERIRCDLRDENLSDEALAEIQLAENCAREDLNPIERAKAFRDMVHTFGCTAKDLAARVGLDPTTVSRHLRLLELPEDLQRDVASGKLPVSVAREAVRLGDDPAAQRELVRKVLDGAIDRDEAAEEVAALVGHGSPRRRSARRSYATDRQFTLHGGGRLRLTSRLPIDGAQLLEDLRRLLVKLEREQGRGQRG